MADTDGNTDALLELDYFVRRMGAAANPAEIVTVVHAYLSNWPKERIIRVQASDAGWVPFDEYLCAFPVSNVGDVRRIRSSVRIRCRELEASGIAIACDLVELDLFFYFANESLMAHESPRTRTPVPNFLHGTAMGDAVNF
jgi:hypothetical protein